MPTWLKGLSGMVIATAAIMIIRAARRGAARDIVIRTAQLDDGKWAYEAWKVEADGSETSVDHGQGFATEALALAQAKARNPEAA